MIELKGPNESDRESWHSLAADYRSLADRAADDLERIHYLWLADYCEKMFRRSDMAERANFVDRGRPH